MDVQETQISAQKPQETNPMGGGIPASPKRVEWIDIAKGVAIIVVVIFHTGGNDEWYNQIGSSFHMPLFFMLSGMCFNDKKYPQFWEYFKRKTRFLLWPMVALSLLCLLICEVADIKYFTLNNIKAGAVLPTPFWFVWILYLAELAFYLLCKGVKRSLLLVALVASLAIGVWLDYCGVPNHFFLNTLFSALFFYGLGYYAKDLLKMLAEKKWVMALFLFPIVQGLMYESHIDMRDNEIYEGFYHTIPVALASCVSLMAICKNLLQHVELIKRPLIWCGKNSFVILGFHVLGIRTAVKYVQPYLYENHFVAFHVTQQIIIWLICISFALLINRYAKWILGK